VRTSSAATSSGYDLTCERPDGTVLERKKVTVDRGRTARVDLSECQKGWRRTGFGSQAEGKAFKVSDFLGGRDASA
jgi:hypothetical protein